MGSAQPGANPVFSSVPVSKFRFGERGNEPAIYAVPQFQGWPEAYQLFTMPANQAILTDPVQMLDLFHKGGSYVSEEDWPDGEPEGATGVRPDVVRTR